MIGVGRFDDFMDCAQRADCPVRPLPNAPNDAEAVATTLKQQEGRAFSKVDLVRVGHEMGSTSNQARDSRCS